MIKIIKTDIGNRSILLEVANLTEDQMLEVDNFLLRAKATLKTSRRKPNLLRWELTMLRKLMLPWTRMMVVGFVL